MEDDTGSESDSDFEKSEDESTSASERETKRLKRGARMGPARQKSPQLAPGDRAPRQRYSPTWVERKKMEASHNSVVNPIPPFEPSFFESWEAFDKIFSAYQAKHCVRYSMRSSRGIDVYNRAHPEDPIPDRFDRSERDYQCVNGRLQRSRGTGQREHRKNYNGCLARIYMKVRRINVDGKNPWRVVVHSETFTHSHMTTKETYDSYFGTRDLDHKNSEMLYAAARMVNTGSNFKHVKEFMAFELGRNISTQTARNIIARVEGKTSPVQRVKSLLSAFAEEEGNHVLLVQDQMDITTLVAMQSRVQKKCFADWGDSFMMDWTHSTNNLGYHLGSLIVTSPTGRGIPVIDFIALNEQADTMRCILEFFKRHNDRWENVETVIIDKDYVEWRVLQECFPKSTVLLCQYHAITYWRKLVRRVKYNLKPKQRDDIEFMFIEMLYSKHTNDYQDAYETFSDYCRRVCPEILRYFEKNWKTCVHMWADHARRGFFTASNTTTNRIEAHWNQLKKRIGVKPKIHVTVAGLLSHQLAVMSQFTTSVRQHVLRSRQPRAIPEFLQRAAASLSDFALEKVSKQFSILMSRMDTAVATRIHESSQWNWMVSTGSRSYRCHDLCWTCTCSFSTTSRLPCRHLLKNAKDVHKFEQLPLSSIPARWCMDRTTEYLEEVERAVQVMSPLIASVKAPGTSLPVTLPATNVTLSEGMGSRPERTKGKGVHHVRLRRHERSGFVVLSRAEKYNLAKAAIEPLLERLTELSSADFYIQLDHWRKIATNLPALPQSDVRQGKSDYPGSKIESDVDSDAFDYIVCPEHARENHDESADEYGLAMPLDDIDLDANPSQVSMPELVISTQSQIILKSHIGDAHHSSSGIEAVPLVGSVLTNGAPNPIEEILPSIRPGDTTGIASPRSSTTNTPPVDPACENETADQVTRGIEVLTMPPPKKQLLTRQKRGRRTAVVDTRVDSNLSVADAIAWAKCTPSIQYVCNILGGYPVFHETFNMRFPSCKWEEYDPETYTYNYVLHETMVNKMHGAIKQFLNKRRTTATSSRATIISSDGGTGHHRYILVWLAPSIEPFSRSFVNQMNEFHLIKSKAKEWVKDCQWLDRDWSRAECEPVGLFIHDTTGTCLKNLALACKSKAETASLHTKYGAISGGTAVRLQGIAGALARSKWLTDEVINLGCQLIVDAMPNDAVTLTSHFFASNEVPPPLCQKQHRKMIMSMSTIKYLIIPVHLPAHWGIFVVDFTVTKKLCIHMYQPKRDTVYDEELQTIFSMKLVPFLEKWHMASERQRVVQEAERRKIDEEVMHVTSTGQTEAAPNQSLLEQPFPQVAVNWINQPQQQDGSSCGVFVLAMAYSIVHRTTSFQEPDFAAHHTVLPEHVHAMRLRLLWKVLCGTVEEKAGTLEVASIHKQIVSENPPTVSRSA